MIEDSKFIPLTRIDTNFYRMVTNKLIRSIRDNSNFIRENSCNI